MRAYGVLAVLAACSGDPQIVLEVPGIPAEAGLVEVLLLEPVVLAKEQRHNDQARNADGSLETVFYMAERSRLSFDRQEMPGEPLRFEIQDAGAEFVPLVRVKSRGSGSGSGTVIALGIYAPDRIFEAPLGAEHRPAAIKPVSDVTIYALALEPVEAELTLSSIAPEPVLPRQVLNVPCGAQGGAAQSGFAWRRGEGEQLRVLVRIEGREAGRLDPPDLDCDAHSPGAQVARASLGDQRDCDDTAFAIHEGARERCSALDEDCNVMTTLSPTTCSVACPTPIDVCVCDDTSGPERCVESVIACKLPSMAASSGTGRLACESAGPLPMPLICQAGCQAMIVSVPEGLEVTISDDKDQPELGFGKWATLTDGTAYLSLHASKPFTTPEVILLRVQAGTAVMTHAVPLQLQDAGCGAPPNLLECTP